MENVKDELDNLKNGLTKSISEVSDIIIDRFKNPYITAFSISWIVCNWQPIAFFIFSNANIEYKINYISKNYSNIYYCLLLPLGLSLFFLFIVPYLNQANEWFVRLSIRKRADYIRDQILDKIKRDTDIAKELTRKEKAIKEARESAQHNEFVESLKKTNESLSAALHQERQKYNSEQAQHADDYARIKLKHETQINELEAKIETMRINYADEKVKAEENFQFEKEIIMQKHDESFLKLKEENDTLREDLKQLDFFIKENSTLHRQLEECKQNK